MREGVNLIEKTSAELWTELQQLRTELETHNHLTSGSQMLNGVVNGIVQSGNFVSGVSGWQLTPTSAEFPSILISGGTIRYGKSSFTDTTNAGYWIGSSGFYFGSATDVSYLKYNIGTGAFDYVGNISGRSSAILAAAISATGHFIDTNLDTSAKTILGHFTFGVSGAIQIGSYVNGVSGDIKISPAGIVGRNSAGANTFALDATTGEITAIKLTGASGSIGGWSINTLAINYDGATDNVSSGMAPADYPFYAGKKYADRATAPFRVTPAGILYATGATIIGNFYTGASGSPRVYIHADNVDDLDSAGNTLFSLLGGQTFWYNASGAAEMGLITGIAGGALQNKLIISATARNLVLRATATGAIEFYPAGALAGTFSSTGLSLVGLLNLATAKTPANAGDTGTLGDICWDTSYIYVCTATNTWKRAGIATW